VASLFTADVDVTVIRVPHEPVAATLKLAIQFIQHEVREQGREHSPNAKGNFCFDRVIALDRSRCVLDLRLKR
jgi:hypothetical protein